VNLPVARLGDIADVNWGNTSITKASYTDTGFPAFSATGCDGYLPTYEHDCEGVVLSAIGAKCGKCFFATGKWTAIKNTITITPPSRKVDFRFLFYYLNREELWFRRGGGQPFIGLGDARRLSVPVPPLAEQRRIAEVLDGVEALRVKRRTTLVQLEAFTQAIFRDLFGDASTNWEGLRLGRVQECVTEVTNGMTRRRKDSGLGRDVVLRLRDIRSGWIDFSSVNRITLTSEELGRYRVSRGDLLFVRVNGNPDYVGRCAVFDGSFAEPVYFNDHIMRIKIDQSKSNGVFLAFVLNSAHGKREISLHRKTSAGQHTINQEGLGKITLPLPPVSLQFEFARRVEAIEKLKAAYRASLAGMGNLFDVLQHRAFRGEL
jgi:type I restriction enzyme S subunit